MAQGARRHTLAEQRRRRQRISRFGLLPVNLPYAAAYAMWT